MNDKATPVSSAQLQNKSGNSSQVYAATVTHAALLAAGGMLNGRAWQRSRQRKEQCPLTVSHRTGLAAARGIVPC